MRRGSYIPQQINNVFRLNFFFFGGGIRNRILHLYLLETIYLITRGFQTYLTRFRSLDTF